jgi:hypothetical protein
MIKFKTKPLPKLAKMLGKDIAGTKKWCAAYEVKIHGEGEQEFVFTSQAESVWITNIVVNLQINYPEDWRERLKAYIR